MRDCGVVQGCLHCSIHFYTEANQILTGPARHITESFVRITDPRVDRGQNHDLLEMIFVALTATICGADGWTDIERFGKAKIDWFRRYVKLEHGMPSHDTFGRVFARLDSGEFLSAMHRWVDAFAGALRGQGVAIDGKTLRGSFDKAASHSPLHTITAFATETRLCLRQISVDDKSNEIPAVPELLKLLELKGSVVTLDAMHCQKETVKAIRDAEADFLITVKGNQPTLYGAIADLFLAYGESDYQVKGLRRNVTVDNKSHGRNERRMYYTIAAPKDGVFADWTDIQSIGMVYRQRETNGKLHEETHFFITSLPPRVKRLSKLLRDHWKIENCEHYVLDVTFSEDASRIRKGSAPEIAGAFRRMALNILQKDTTIKDTIRGKRLRAGWDGVALDAIFTGFQTA